MRRLAVLLALYSTTALAQDQTATTEPPVVETTMGDDSYIQVNLNFDFPLYGQLFNQSWMYDNGIISFLQPGTPGSLSPWQWSATPINQAPGNYFIASLWADMAPTSITKYSYQGDSTFMKYSWSNIAEYYSAGSSSPRYNSFSTTIKPDGSISTSYYSLNLMTSNVSAGVAGNLGAGEYDSKFFAPYGTVITTGGIADWTSGGGYVPPPPPPEPEPYVPHADPVIEQPIVEPAPPQVIQEPIQEVSVTPATIQQEEPILETVQEIVEEAPVVVEQAIQTEVEVEATATIDKKSVNIDAKAIAKANQEALAALTDSVVSGSIQGSLEAGNSSSSNSLSSLLSTTTVGGDLSNPNALGGVLGPGVSNSTENSQSSSNLVSADVATSLVDSGSNSTQIVQGSDQASSIDSSSQSESQINSTISTQAAPLAQQSNSQQASYISQSEDIQIVDIVATMPSSLSTEQQSSYTTTLSVGGLSQELLVDASNFNTQEESTVSAFGVDSTQTAIVDESNPVSIRSLADMTTARIVQTEEEEIKKPEIDDIASAQDPALAELSSVGVQMSTLQVVPVGYFSYLNLVYKDRSFYPERIIYRKQKVVDNQRVLRMLNARSDLTYDKMVKEQYSLNDITGTSD